MTAATDLLRSAASAMRERAEAATSVTGCETSLRESEHIASWGPAVAFAVADWLDAAYAQWAAAENSLSAMSVRAMSGEVNEPDPRAVAVARAYLGRDEA